MSPPIIATRIGPMGGPGGTPFEDSHVIENYGPINQIAVRHGSKVDSIAIGYENGNYFSHGGTGGTLTTINLQDGEYVTKVTGRAANEVDHIMFFTNKGRRFGPYGGWGGSPFSCELAGDNALLYVFGRSKNRLDQIGFGFGKQPPSLDSEVTRSEAKGGSGGLPFNHISERSLLGKISHIKVRSASRVDSLAVDYKGADTITEGGSGGVEEDFWLEDNEFIVEIRGRAASRLDQIQFITNTGRFSLPFGGSGGTPFSLKMEGAVVKAFYGRSMSEIDQIGVYFENGKPLKFEILSMDYDMSAYKWLAASPVAGLSAILTNTDSTKEQVCTSSVTITSSDSTSTSIAESHNASVSVTYTSEFKATIVPGAEVSQSIALSVGYEYGHTETTETTHMEERSETFTYSTKVAAGKSMRGTCIIKRDRYDVPWTATARVTYQDRKNPVTETIHGVLKGVKASQIEASYENID